MVLASSIFICGVPFLLVGCLTKMVIIDQPEALQHMWLLLSGVDFEPICFCASLLQHFLPKLPFEHYPGPSAVRL